ncbi:MAG: glycosyltransferase family 4 protein [Candidatus Omnitrophota bacterium]|nr:glycosyltransferase family 4 protein [Candidatus Omnitrophota bacterium]
MKNKRVLILLENLPLPSDRRAWTQAKALKESGRDVSVVCPRFKGQKGFEVIDGIYLYRYAMTPATKGALSYICEFSYCFLMTLMLSFYVYVRRGFDVIQSGNPPDTFFAIGLIFKCLGKKYYFDHRDLCPEVYLAKYGENKKDIFYRALFVLEYLTYKTADRILVPNKSYREIGISRNRVRPDKIFVVRGSPDPAAFKTAQGEPSLKQGKKYLVAYMGVMAPQDGVDYLLRAVDVIVNKLGRRDILFSLTGRGDAVEDLKKMAERLGISGAIVFTGWLTGDTMMKYLSTSELCVAPDPKNAFNNTSTANKILEYMAVSKPIVSFDLKEARYSAGEAAVYARPNEIKDFAEKILELLEDPERRQKMGMEGYRRLKGELSADYNKRILLSAYDI